jgi:hypothetical protein
VKQTPNVQTVCVDGSKFSRVLHICAAVVRDSGRKGFMDARYHVCLIIHYWMQTLGMSARVSCRTDIGGQRSNLSLLAQRAPYGQSNCGSQTSAKALTRIGCGTAQPLVYWCNWNLGVRDANDRKELRGATWLTLRRRFFSPDFYACASKLVWQHASWHSSMN